MPHTRGLNHIVKFSLRELMLAVLVLCFGLGWAVTYFQYREYYYQYRKYYDGSGVAIKQWIKAESEVGKLQKELKECRDKSQAGQ